MKSRLLQLDNLNLIIRNFHENFLLLSAEDGSSVTTLGKLIFAEKFNFIDEVIVTEKEIALKLNQRFTSAKMEQLARLSTPDEHPVNTYRLPIHFTDNEDWAGITAATNFPKAEVIQQLLTSDFTVAMFGFLPGFVYLNGLPEQLQVPRKTVPAKYVSANSVAIGGKYLGVYALDSPGGWHVIGKVPVSILQIPELPPVAVNLADRLQLVSIGQEEFIALSAQQTNLIDYNA